MSRRMIVVMQRRAAMIAAALAMTVPPCAAAGGPPRPAKAKLVPPPGYQAVTFVPVPAAPKGPWWKRRRGCGRGRTMQSRRFTRPGSLFFESHVCRQRGERDGPYVTLRRNGTIFEEGVSRRGKEHGLRRGYHANGVRSLEIPFVAGKRHGLKRRWCRYSKLISETTYVRGVKSGPAKLVLGVDKRTVISKGYYINGQRHGLWFATDSGGQVLARVLFAHGATRGAAWWYPEGKLWATARRVGDQLVWRRYDRRGRLEVKAICKNGLVRATGWLRDEGAGPVVRLCGASWPPRPRPGCAPIKADGRIMTWLGPVNMCREPLGVPLWIYIKGGPRSR